MFAAVAMGCGGEEGGEKAKAPAEAVPVTVASPRVDGVQRSVEVVGTLFGQEDVIISNKVPGKVIAIYKDIGDRVAPGEPLAQLLQNDYQLTLNERQSALQEVLSALGLDDVPPESFDFETLPAVRRARLEAENARDKLERVRHLREAKPPLISEQDWADLETAAKVAQSAYEAARLEARSQVGLARTRKAQVAIAEQALRDTTIRAPRPMRDSISGAGDDEGPTFPAAPATQPTADATGRAAVPAPSGPTFAVAARYSSEGELNAGLTRMFRLVIDDPLKLRANVPERHAGRINVGQPVVLRVESETREFKGSVTRINPQIDPANRSFEVEINVANPDRLLKPGAFARAEILTRVEPDVLLVPGHAVVSFAGVKKVFAVRDGKAVEVPIETGVRLGDWVEVVKGAKLGHADRIVVEGVNRLANGVAVTARDAGPTTRP